MVDDEHLDRPFGWLELEAELVFDGGEDGDHIWAALLHGDIVGPSHSIPTLQVVVNPRIAHGGNLNAPSFAALKELGADYVRYVP